MKKTITLEATGGEAALIAWALESAAKRFDTTARRPGSEELRQIQKIKAVTLHSAAATFKKAAETDP